MNYIQKELDVDARLASMIRDRIYGYLNGSIAFPDAAATLRSHLGTSAPLDQIHAILHAGPCPVARPGGLQPIERRRKTREWTQWEDQRLLAGIYRYGLGNWRSIADYVGNNRTRAQCCQRWYRGLDPNIVKGNWTRETDDELLALVALHGDKCWTQIAAELGNRCDVQCRYRYHQLAKSPNFEERMAFVRNKTAGMPHTKRPRKRQARAFPAPANRSQAAGPVQMAPQQWNANGRVRLPPIEEMAGIIGIKPRRIMEIS